MSIGDSNGAIIELLQAVDPDNEGSVSNKQSLLYSTNDVISDAPFRLRDNRLFKYKVRTLYYEYAGTKEREGLYFLYILISTISFHVSAHTHFNCYV